MGDWLDDLDDDEPALEAEIVEPELLPTTVKQKLTKTTAERDKDAIKEIEDKILSESIKTLEVVPGWAELDPDNPEEMPEGWVKEFGEKEARRRHRIAQAACLSAGKAPVGLHIAKDLAVGILRNRKEPDTGSQKLNIIAVQIPIEHATITYERQDVDD